MSRSGYVEDIEDQWQLIRWRGAVKAAIKGKRGQAFLREMLAAMDTVAGGRLIANDLQDADGEVCAIGAVGKARGVDITTLDPDEYEGVAAKFGIATALAQEIVWMNDECSNPKETPEQRFARMRKWVNDQIVEVKT